MSNAVFSVLQHPLRSMRTSPSVDARVFVNRLLNHGAVNVTVPIRPIDNAPMDNPRTMEAYIHFHQYLLHFLTSLNRRLSKARTANALRRWDY
jgi:hypothetical protein